MSINANPSEFVSHITLGSYSPYAYNSIIFPRSNLTHAVAYSEHATLAGVSRMGAAVD